MKLQNFLIGIGVFALFTVIIFGFVDNNGGSCQGIYCKDYLNITHDTETNDAIANISGEGNVIDDDFQSNSDNLGSFTSNRSAYLEPTEGNLIAEGAKVLVSLPNSWKPTVNILRLGEQHLNIPSQFTQWAIASIIIIVILILLTAFLKQRLQT